MSKYLRVTSSKLEWSRYKAAQELRDLKMHLSRIGAPNSTVELLEWPPKGVKVANQTFIHLKCKSCGEVGGTWYAASFTACPTCGQRKSVVKATVARKVPPADAVMVT